MLHHLTEYSTDNGISWQTVVADEAVGPNKSFTITGLSVGTYTCFLKITPLSGGGPSVLSNSFLLTVGSFTLDSVSVSYSTVTASMTSSIKLAGSILGQANASSSLYIPNISDITSNVLGVASASGSLLTNIKFNGLVTANTTVGGNLLNNIKFLSSFSGIGALTGALTTPAPAASYVTDFESGADGWAYWVDALGDMTGTWAVYSIDYGIVATDSHSPSHSYKVLVGDWDGGYDGGCNRTGLTKTVVTSAGNITAWVKSPSTAGSFQQITVLIDGVVKGNITANGSWQQISAPVTSGSHTIRICGSGDGLSQAFTLYIDDISVPV